MSSFGDGWPNKSKLSGREGKCRINDQCQSSWKALSLRPLWRSDHAWNGLAKCSDETWHQRHDIRVSLTYKTQFSADHDYFILISVHLRKTFDHLHQVGSMM